MSTLRPYQVELLDAARAEIRKGHRAICIVLPTGGGKTRIGTEIMRGPTTRGKRALWLAHRVELVRQAADRIRAEGVDRVGIIAAGIVPDPDALVQVASVQTLRARSLYPAADTVVLDEAHHYVAEDWGELAQHYADAYRIGLTATPERSDGGALGDLFSALVSTIHVAQLTELGYLVPCDVLAPPSYLKGQIAGDPVDRYLEAARGRRAIFFCARVSQAEEIASRLTREGVPAACISDSTPADIRAAALDAFTRGDLLALTNVYVLTEGTDLPPAEVCVLARGFGHASTYLQCVGRVLRPSPATGKTGALVLDLAGASRKFGVPADERTYSLDGRAISLADKPAPLERGPGGVVRVPEIVDAELAAVRTIESTLRKYTRGRVWGERADTLRTLLRDAQRRGRKLGSAVYAYRDLYGCLPWEG